MKTLTPIEIYWITTALLVMLSMIAGFLICWPIATRIGERNAMEALVATIDEENSE